MRGQRGRAKLVFDGNTFFRTKDYGVVTYWLCSMAKNYHCKAKLWTNRDTNTYCFTQETHNHVKEQLDPARVEMTTNLDVVLRKDSAKRIK